MTVHYIERKKEVVERVAISTTCDRCGKELLKRLSYEVRDFELKLEVGSAFPDSGSVEGWEVPDLCDDCIVFLHGLLEANGFTLHEIERDW